MLNITYLRELCENSPPFVISAAAREALPELLHRVEVLERVAEEAGEVVKASLDMTYDGGSVEDVRTELAQTGAMCIRMLVNLHNNEVKLNQEKEREYDPYDAIRENMEPRA